jgi:hypothetical protein
MLRDTEASHSEDNKYSIRKPNPDFLSGLLIFPAYRSPFSSYSRKFDSAAAEAPPVGENNSIRKSDPELPI